MAPSDDSDARDSSSVKSARAKTAKKAPKKKPSDRKSGTTAPKRSATTESDPSRAAAPETSEAPSGGASEQSIRTPAEPRHDETPIEAAVAGSEQPAGAAFFDLDRTLLTGASGPYISEALRHVGLINQRSTGLESIAFRVFDLIGETRPAMLVTRQGARMAKGWSIDLVRKAARMAAEPLSEAVVPYALPLFEEHRAAGRRLVLATTTPVDLVTPLADALGFDDVIATRYGEHDGRYDGTIDGIFVWGRDKARAVAEWADRHDVDLDASYAYSDSYYDVPLLSIVGHPNAVNPDPRMLGIATLRRWPVVHLDEPAGVPKLLGVEPQRVAMLLSQPQLFPYVRFDIDGLERIPMHGKTILVANHRSYFDPLALGYLLSKRGRTVRFLGKKEVFDAPIVGELVSAMGGIRVERGSGSEEPLKAAEDALAAGEMVAMMPQGTIPRGPAFFDPVLQGRWGVAKLALATGATVVPVGIWGTEKVWPRSSKLPDVTKVLSPHKVRIRVGEPVHLDGKGYDPTDADPDRLDAATSEVMSAIVDLLPAEARTRRTPSREELAATYPDGRIPDDVDDAAAHEADRRPGTD